MASLPIIRNFAMFEKGHRLLFSNSRLFCNYFLIRCSIHESDTTLPDYHVGTAPRFLCWLTTLLKRFCIAWKRAPENFCSIAILLQLFKPPLLSLWWFDLPYVIRASARNFPWSASVPAPFFISIWSIHLGVISPPSRVRIFLVGFFCLYGSIVFQINFRG